MAVFGQETAITPETPQDTGGVAVTTGAGGLTPILALHVAGFGVPPVTATQDIEREFVREVRTAVETPTALLVAPPVLNPVPAQEVVLVEVHLTFETAP